MAIQWRFCVGIGSSAASGSLERLLQIEDNGAPLRREVPAQ